MGGSHLRLGGDGSSSLQQQLHHLLMAAAGAAVQRRQAVLRAQGQRSEIGGQRSDAMKLLCDPHLGAGVDGGVALQQQQHHVGVAPFGCYVQRRDVVLRGRSHTVT